jgi:hypothetical protein
MKRKNDGKSSFDNNRLPLAQFISIASGQLERVKILKG